jgi:hypothetical protein
MPPSNSSVPKDIRKYLNPGACRCLLIDTREEEVLLERGKDGQVMPKKTGLDVCDIVFAGSKHQSRGDETYRAEYCCKQHKKKDTRGRVC